MITVVPELDIKVKIKYDNSGPGTGYSGIIEIWSQ